MKYRVYLSEPAERDLRGIIQYISTQLMAPAAALNMADAIEEALSGLMDMPVVRMP